MCLRIDRAAGARACDALARSALTFSSGGDLGGRTVDADGTRAVAAEVTSRKQIMNDRPLGLMERRLRRGQTVT